MDIGFAERVKASGVFSVVCRNVQGKVLWKRKFKNTVTSQGKDYLLDKFLSGSGYNATFYVGLISSDSYSAISSSDTAASHAGWAEAGVTADPAYIGARKSLVWGAASGGSKTGVSASFVCSTPGTVKGAFLASVPTVDSTSGIIYSAGLFSGGNQIVVATNTLVVTYTGTVS